MVQWYFFITSKGNLDREEDIYLYFFLQAAVEEFWQETYKITKTFAKSTKKADSKDKLTATTRRTSSMSVVKDTDQSQDAYSVSVPFLAGYCTVGKSITVLYY